MIDRRPVLIARCAGADDVAAAVNLAREEDLPLSIYGGGHGVTGSAVVDAGICIDLRTMNGIAVDPEARTVRAEGGLTWGEFDAATQEHGLAVTGGRVTGTGIAGLALGGGSGWLERKLGFTCDNLIQAEVVTADGRQVVASEEENADLF
ncbi:MAG: FAD-dependent oxidoreductase [Actinomycetota bacterium]|nr:FAD-dependent oxidoreductase [Actinomycetota bacterium]